MADDETPLALQDPNYRVGIVDLLGALAYGELTAFERLAEDSKMAPTVTDKAELAAMACAEFGHFAALRDRLVALEADPAEAMAPFEATFDKFHEHTAPADWLESLPPEPERRIIAVSHGVSGRVLRGVYGNLPRDAAVAQDVPQDAVYRLVDGVYRDEGRFRRGGLIADPSLPWVSVEVNDLVGDYTESL